MSDDSRHQAIQRLHQRRSFLNYVIGAIVVSILMVVIWALTGRGYFWPAWVMAGFLVGLVFMGISMAMNKPITEDQIQKEMQKGS